MLHAASAARRRSVANEKDAEKTDLASTVKEAKDARDVLTQLQDPETSPSALLLLLHKLGQNCKQPRLMRKMMKEAGAVLKAFVVVFRNNVDDLPLLTAACEAFRMLVCLHATRHVSMDMQHDTCLMHPMRR